MYTRICLCMYEYDGKLRKDTHIWVNTNVYMYIHIPIHACMNMHTHICVHITLPFSFSLTLSLSLSISTFMYIFIYISIHIPLVFTISPGDPSSILGRVIPKTLKMVLDTTLLNTQQYNVHIKGKVEQFWDSCSHWKGSLLVALDSGRQLYFLFS